MMKLLAFLFFSLAVALDAAPPEIKVTPDLAYKSGPTLTAYEQTRCKLDLYAPAEAKDLPCLVWFYGGGLTGGSKAGKGTIAAARRLAEEGMIVAVVDYRLSPQVKYPAYIEDAAAAVAWVHGHAGAYGGNAQRLFVGGHSAGGYLTAMVGVDDRWLQPYRLSPRDLAGFIPLSGQMATHYTIREERGLPKTTIIIDEAAPLNHTRQDTPPWLILYAEKDMTLRGDENRYFAAAMKAAGHPYVTIQEMAGHDHGSIGENLSKDSDTVRAAMVNFIKEKPAK
jgi:acetyl esterase/lipase